MLYLIALCIFIIGVIIGKSWLMLYLSLILIFIPIANFRYKKKVVANFCLAILACTVYRIYKSDLNIRAGVLMLMLAIFALLISYAIKKYFDSQINYSEIRVNKFKMMLDDLSKDQSYLNSANIKLENELLEIENLYELTRVMSATLEFKDIFNILSYALKRLFRFSFCRLLLINDEDNKSIKKIYLINPMNLDATKEHPLKLRSLLVDLSKLPNIATESDLSQAQPIDKVMQPIDVEVSRFILKEKKPIIIKSDREDEIGITKLQKVKTFIATGLMIENKMIGILYMVDCDPNDFERFLIIASQFALEFEKVRLYQMIQELAIIDSLTDVFVRRYLLERLEEELSRSSRHNTKFSFLMLDIDHFKECNDKFGHLVGDVILKEVARLVKSNVREVDLVARFGGEEFCIGLPDTAKAEAVHVAERIRATIAECLFKAYDEAIKTSISIGVATFPDDANNIQDLIDMADKFMYCAKEKGRNCVYS